MSRIVFRALVAITLLIMFLARQSGGQMPAVWFAAFYNWFLISVVVFTAFGISAALHAWREPINRRAWMFDIVLAAIWVPYWYANLR